MADKRPLRGAFWVLGKLLHIALCRCLAMECNWPWQEVLGHNFGVVRVEITFDDTVGRANGR